MPLINAMHCCGVKELHGISAYGKVGGRFSPLNVIRRLGVEAYNIGAAPQADWNGGLFTPPEIDGRFRYAIFTQAVANQKLGLTGYGVKLANFITKNGLGTLTETEQGTNPNSGNTIRLWVWTIDHAAVKKLLKDDIKEQKKKEKK